MTNIIKCKIANLQIAQQNIVCLFDLKAILF
jgi:hypothetical protein